MRLSAHQINAIINVLESYINKQACELRLFGSRVDDEAKGGDIDLLLITSDENFNNDLLFNKHQILAAIKKRIGEQKIDLKIVTNAESQNDPFLQMILPSSILLKQWEQNE